MAKKRSYTGRDIEVLEGLDPGSRVVVRGNETLTEGQQVRILKSSSTAVD